MNITTIGGGTGTTAVLKGLREYPDLNLSAIVSMTDDGGSNASVRDEFGLLPLSDLRKSIIALSGRNKDEMFRKLFMYRFSKGVGISGHTLGNLIMIALSNLTGSEVEAIKACSELFDIKGSIIPVTLDKVRLVAEYSDGSKLIGEHLIDESNKDKRIVKLSVSSKPKANEEAVNAILKSDFIVIGPGDLYTSLIANLVIPGIPEVLRETKGKIVYISNLMSKLGETRGFNHSDMVLEIQKYIGRPVDYLLINNGNIPKEVMDIYKKDGEAPFKDDINSKTFPGLTVIRSDLISRIKIKKKKGDELKRSLIRHSDRKIGSELYNLFRKNHFALFSWLVKDIN
ncbi:uridine diphosphate-N-acetylglucosamine-binding protein YvcK [Candidatus Dojkabacteria bacterium]|nr:uridine diphosphate-N-acetylglucosamine-binding protein YvcK [Candidatus Dojkabacteria bacterium]